MEELHKAALAYYNNSTPYVQQKAYEFFEAMDSDRDGRVSRSELTEFLWHSGYYGRPYQNDVFSELDRNGDGSLDFWEVLTLYYILKTRDLVCQHCHVCPKGLYFTCVTCFDDVGPTYDLCADCYVRRDYLHPHPRFLDNYALLRLKRPYSASSTYPQNNHQALIAHPPAEPWRSFTWWDAFKALEIAIGIGSLACGVSACTIM